MRSEKAEVNSEERAQGGRGAAVLESLMVGGGEAGGIESRSLRWRRFQQAQMGGEEKAFQVEGTACAKTQRLARAGWG